MNRELKFKVLEALTTLPAYSSAGICVQATDHFWADHCHTLERNDYRQLREWLTKTAMRWPLYSGNKEYPVPPPDGNDARDAYYYAIEERTAWDTQTQYGRARYYLLSFFILEMLKELE